MVEHVVGQHISHPWLIVVGHPVMDHGYQTLILIKDLNPGAEFDSHVPRGSMAHLPDPLKGKVLVQVSKAVVVS